MPTWRLARLAPELPFRVGRSAVFAGGNSNDAWFFDDLVLRVCWRADRARLRRESAVLAELPAQIPHFEQRSHDQGRREDQGGRAGRLLDRRDECRRRLH